MLKDQQEKYSDTKTKFESLVRYYTGEAPCDQVQKLTGIGIYRRPLTVFFYIYILNYLSMSISYALPSFRSLWKVSSRYGQLSSLIIDHFGKRNRNELPKLCLRKWTRRERFVYNR